MIGDSTVAEIERSRRRRFWNRGRCHRSRSGQRDGDACIEALKRHRNGEDDRRGFGPTNAMQR
jgi:hypothetical protein